MIVASVYLYVWGVDNVINKDVFILLSFVLSNF